MAQLPFIHVCYILTLINRISGSRVVVAGNEEALRNLAKRLAPQTLVNRLASLVQGAPAPVYEDPYYPNPNEGGQNEPAYVNRDYGNAYANAAENPVENPALNPAANTGINPGMNPVVNPAAFPANPPEYPAIAPFELPDENQDDYVQQTTKFFRQSAGIPVSKKTQSMQVNLDELVEKVKDRLMQELKTRQTPVSNPRLKARTKPQRPVSVARPVPQRIPKNTPQAPMEYEEASSIPAIQSVPPSAPKKRPPPIIVNGPAATTKKRKPAGILVEKADLYDKFKLGKHKGKDSYEDYVIPKKEYDVFATGEDDKIVKREFSKESPGALSQEQKTATVKRKEVQQEQVDETVVTNNNNNNNAPAKRLKAVTPNVVTTSKEPFTEPTSKIEYVDDDYYTKVTTTEHIPKAMTEFIGMDSKEDEAVVETETTTELEKGRKKKPKKIVTNMPTRARFKMSTPNYYEKLPRIAEKYNFDEPIPERDREEEDLKPFPTAEAKINGRGRV